MKKILFLLMAFATFTATAQRRGTQPVFEPKKFLDDTYHMRNVGIGTLNPAVNLHVMGNIRLVPTTDTIANGKVLTSDGSGNAHWRTPATGGGSGWGLTGNAGTNPASNFIGTTDSKGLNLGVDGQTVIHIDSSANRQVTIGFDNSTSTALSIRGGWGSYYDDGAGNTGQLGVNGPFSYSYNSISGSTGLNIGDGVVLNSSGNVVLQESNSYGSVGIGVSSPARKVDINGELQLIKVKGDTTTTALIAQEGVTFATGTSTTGSGLALRPNGFSEWNTTGNIALNATGGTGNVGIGTTTPGYKLDVGGDINGTFTNDDLKHQLEAISTDNSYRSRAWFKPNQIFFTHSNDGTSSDSRFIFEDNITLFTASANNIILQEDNTHGNVGIGTSSPGYTLEVDGTLYQEHTSGTVTTSLKSDAADAARIRANNSVGSRAAYVEATGVGYVNIQTQGPAGSITTQQYDEYFDISSNAASYIIHALRTGNVGIGVETPASKLTVTDGDIEITDVGDGIIMKSPDGSCWRLTPSNLGVAVFTSITCP